MNRHPRPRFINFMARRKTLMGSAFMLTRDMPLGIMPYGSSRHGSSSYQVSLTPQNDDIIELVKKLLSVGDHEGFDLAESVAGYVDTLTNYIGHYGEIYAEIIGEGDSVTLDILPPAKIIHLGPWYLQLVPFPDWSKKSWPFAFIPSNKVWHVKLPRQLGTPRSHRRLLRRLDKLSSPMPKFVEKDGDMGAKSRYDFMLHHNAKQLATERLTSKWGTIPSLGEIKGTTEYYFMVNNLQFAYSRALLREHFISEFNRLLKMMKLGSRLQVTGLPLAKDIREAISKLEAGDIGFAEAVEVTKLS